MVIIAIIVIAIIYISIILYGAFSWGFVLYKLWYWFLLPVFPSLPAIDFKQAIGLMLIVALFHNTNIPTIKDEYLKDGDDKAKSAAVALLIPWFVLLACWIVKLFIS